MKEYSAERVASDIADLARVARKITSAGRDTFFDTGEGEVLRKAGRQVVTDVSSAVGRLSRDVKAANPEIPWRDIQRTRNYVAHAYDTVNDDVIWAALDGEIDRIANVLAKYRDV